MKIESILTKRSFEHWPSYDLVYEWEDILAKKLGCPLVNENKILYKSFLKKLSFIPNLFQPRKISFKFEMNPILKHRIDNRKNFVPCIIDYYLHDDRLPDLISSYSRNSVVCISSKEVYDHLLEKGVKEKLNIEHLALSISDKYRITEESVFEKKYDLVLMGRQNPVLKDFLDTYEKKHKDLYYVYREKKGNEFLYYTSRGECLGNIDTREKYMSLMKLAKCGLYSTPGIDGGESRTNGFSQVTPRFLELIACGCHIIARYKQNSDTDYYQLGDFSQSIDDYESFERALDLYRNSNVDMAKYSKYLSNHYTSNRAECLSKLIEL